MKKFADVSLFLLRVSMGWVLFYAGVAKLMNPAWSAKGYLMGAKTFTGFYQWLASDAMLPLTNFLNEWGLTLLGLALILGVCIRLTGALSALLMVLYYFPILVFPKPNVNSYIIDDHIIYALVCLVLIGFNAGRVWGLESWYEAQPWFKKLCKRWA